MLNYYERNMLLLIKLICAHFYLEQEFKSHLGWLNRFIDRGKNEVRVDGFYSIMQLCSDKVGDKIQSSRN